MCEFKQSVLEDPETILQPSLLCHSHFLCHKNSLKMILPCTQPLKFLLDPMLLLGKDRFTSSPAQLIQIKSKRMPISNRFLKAIGLYSR